MINRDGTAPKARLIEMKRCGNRWWTRVRSKSCLPIFSRGAEDLGLILLSFLYVPKIYVDFRLCASGIYSRIICERTLDERTALPIINSVIVIAHFLPSKTRITNFNEKQRKFTRQSLPVHEQFDHHSR